MPSQSSSSEATRQRVGGSPRSAPRAEPARPSSAASVKRVGARAGRRARVELRRPRAAGRPRIATSSSGPHMASATRRPTRAELGGRALRVREVVDDERAEHGVEGAVLEGQPLGVARARTRPRGCRRRAASSMPSARSTPGDARAPRRGRAGEVAEAGADVEHAVAGARRRRRRAAARSAAAVARAISAPYVAARSLQPLASNALNAPGRLTARRWRRARPRCGSPVSAAAISQGRRRRGPRPPPRRAGPRRSPRAARPSGAAGRPGCGS